MALRRVQLDIISGTELPTLVVPWYDANGDLVDLSAVSSWILRLQSSSAPGTTVAELTSGFTGANGSVTIGKVPRLAIGALNTSTTATALYYGELTVDPSGDPRKALLAITVHPAAQDIP